MIEKSKHSNWKVSKTKSGHFLLEYMPGLLGVDGAIVRVSEEVYNTAKNKNISLEHLFSKYQLQKNEILSIIKPTIYPSHNPKINTLTKYQGIDFFVTEEKGRYFLKYRLARHGDGERKFEISKKIYKDARTGKYSTSDLFKKYNLYHLDVPENDVE